MTLADLGLTPADYFAYLRGTASDRIFDLCDAHIDDPDFPWPSFLLLEVILRRTNRGTRYQLRDHPLPPTCPFMGRPLTEGCDCWCDDCPHATDAIPEHAAVPFFKRYWCEV